MGPDFSYGDSVNSVSHGFTPDVAAQLGDADQRRDLTAALADLPLPTTDAEEWRYSPIGELDLAAYTPVTAPPDRTVDAVSGAACSAQITIIDGFVVEVDRASGVDGLHIEVVTGPAPSTADVDRTALDVLHEAFSPATLSIRVDDGATIADPVLINSHHTGSGRAAFGSITVEVGVDAKLAVVENQTSADGPGLNVPRVSVTVGDAGRASYATIQDLGADLWQLARQHSVVGQQGNAELAIAAFGGAYARLRTDTTLAGRGANGDLLAVYYGDADQVLDFRTFQSHAAADTTSDLAFKGTVDDRAGSIYTGLIRIEENGRNSNAHQANRNIKLSDDAWAWSVPNLEIENNEVRCSHASTVSPVDEDQRFFLHARGVPPRIADRLIVAGFFADVVDRFPEVLRDGIVTRVADKLDRRERRVGDDGAAA